MRYWNVYPVAVFTLPHVKVAKVGSVSVAATFGADGAPSVVITATLEALVSRREARRIADRSIVRPAADCWAFNETLTVVADWSAILRSAVTGAVVAGPLMVVAA